MLYAALDHEANLGQVLYNRSGSANDLINIIRETCDLLEMSSVSEPLGREGEVTGLGK